MAEDVLDQLKLSKENTIGFKNTDFSSFLDTVSQMGKFSLRMLDENVFLAKFAKPIEGIKYALYYSNCNVARDTDED